MIEIEFVELFSIVAMIVYHIRMKNLKKQKRIKMVSHKNNENKIINQIFFILQLLLQTIPVSRALIS